MTCLALQLPDLLVNQGWSTVDQGWRTVPTKKTKFGPKVVSHCWWLQQAREEPIPYQVPYSAYQLGRFKALAEYEYSVLGKGIIEEITELEYFEKASPLVTCRCLSIQGAEPVKNIKLTTIAPKGMPNK